MAAESVHGHATRRFVSCGAVSLIELLVILSVVALLVMLVVPGFDRARRAANRAADIGNMRQIGIAVERFTQDHFNEGRIFFAHDRYNEPERRYYNSGPYEWYRLLRPYFDREMDDYNTEVSVFISPGDPTRGGARTVHAPQHHAFLRRSYSFNIETIDHAAPPLWRRTNSLRRSSILNPSFFMLFGNHRATEIGTIWIAPEYDWSMEGIPDDWFDGGMANFAFLDGHIESILVEDVMPGGPRHNIFYPELDQ